LIGRELKLLAGNANRPLAEEVSAALGIELCQATVGRFSDGEVRVKIDETVRGADVFVIQPTSPPVNDNLMELLIMVDALRRASVRQVVAVIPYYGYARQDRKHIGRVPISARLVANLLETAGVDRVLTMELHVGQIQGFFNIPVDNLRTDPVFADYIRDTEPDLSDMIVVSPDVGGLGRARRLAEQLHLPLAVLEKRRNADGIGIKEIRVIGEVRGKRAILIDDIVSTGGTLAHAAQVLIDHGTVEVCACCTHGVFAGDAIQTLKNSPLKKVIVTNTISHGQAEKEEFIEYIPVGEHLAKTIRRIFENKSVSHLFPLH